MRSFALITLLAACSAPAKSTAPSDPAPTPTVTGTESRPSPPPPATGGCPSIQIKAPDSVSAGQQARIQTITADGTPSTYNWSVSAGTIKSGQGTPMIAIDTTGLAGASITATVELGGLAAECETRTASATLLVGP